MYKDRLRAHLVGVAQVFPGLLNSSTTFLIPVALPTKNDRATEQEGKGVFFFFNETSHKTCVC